MIRESQAWVGSRRTRYLEAGAGWPLLFLHAFPLNADMWRPQLERVPDGWHYIAVDLRGFGPLAEPLPDLATMQQLADDVCAFVNELRLDQVVLCGLSMGGYVAFAAWSLIAEQISGLVLADTRPEADSAEARQGRRTMMELVDRQGVEAVADQMLPKLLGETSRRERPGVAHEVRRLAQANSGSAVKSALHAMMNRPDSSSILPKIARPVLVLVGEEDTITPPDVAEHMQRTIPRSTLVVLRAAGHLSNLEAPTEFSAAIADFLSSTR